MKTSIRWGETGIRWLTTLLTIASTRIGPEGMAATQDSPSNDRVRISAESPTASPPLPTTLQQVGGIDEYTFTVGGTEPQQYVFDALTDNPGLLWSLAGPMGPVITDRFFTSSDSTSLGDGDLVRVLPPGDYRLGVRNSGNQTPEYDFRLLRPADAPLLAPGAPVNAPLAPGNSTRLFQFQGAFGDRVRLQLALTNLPSGAIARLADPFGRVVARTTTGPSAPVTLTTAGAFLVTLEGAIGNGAEPGSFGLNVEPLGNESPYLPGAPLVLNQRTFLTNSTPFTNFYRLTILADTWLAWTSLSPNYSVQWELLGPAGPMGAERFGDDSAKAWLAPAGEYQLAIWSLAANPGISGWTLQDVATLPTLGLETDRRATNRFNSEDVYFRLPLQAGQQIYAQALSASDSFAGRGMQWTVWNPLGGVAFSASWSDVLFTTLVSGDYRVGLHASPQDPDTEGVREFRFSTVTNTLSDLSLGQIVAGRIAMPGQIQRHRLVLNQAARLSLDFLDDTQALWDLSGPKGSLGGGRFTSEPGTVFELPAGEVFLTVRGSGRETPDFAFRFLDLNAAEAFDLGDTITRQITPAAGRRIFRVELASGQKFYPRILDYTGFTTTAPSWRLDSPSGRTLFNQSMNSEPGIQTAPAAGTYTLFIDGGLGESLSDSGTVTFAFLPILDTTTPLTLGTEINDSIQTPGQTRSYPFSLSERTRISVDTLESSPAYFRLTGPAGDVNPGSRFWQDSSWVYDLDPGAYTLTAYTAGPETPPVRFQVIAAAAGPTLSLNSNHTLNFPSARHSRWVRFNLIAGQRLYADPIGQTTWNPNQPSWQLISPNGRAIFDSNFLPQSAFTIPTTGTYDLLIGGLLGEPEIPASVTFALRTSPESTEPLLLGADIADSLTVQGQARRYTFTLASDTWLSFNSRAAANLQWQLRGPWGPVAATYFYNNRWQPLEAPRGDYTLEVFGSAAETGSYRFSLLNLLAAPPVALGVETVATFNPNASTITYSLDLVAGQKVQARLLGRAGFSSVGIWTLVDPNGTRLFESPSTTDATTTAILSGRHVLMLVGPSTDAGFNGTMRFVIEDQGVTPPPAFAGAAVILGQEISGTLPDASATNAYTFSLAQPAMLHFDALSASGQTVTVLNRRRVLQQDQLLANLDSGGSASMLFRAEPGDYQVVLRGSGAYRFRILDATSAPLLAADTDVAIVNTPGNASELRRFAGRAGEQVYFLGRPYSGFGERPAYSVWRPDGARFNGWFSDTEASWTLPQSGDYYFLFGVPVANAAAQGTHNLRLATVRERTEALALNTPTTATIPSPDGVARFEINLSAPTRVAFDAISLTSGDSQPYWRLDSPERSWRTDSIFNQADVFASPTRGNAFFDLPAGTHTLSFRASSPPATPTFRFAVWDLGTTALPIALNTVISGTNQPTSQSHFYSFDASAGDALVFQGISFSNFSEAAYADLYFPNGQGRDLWRLDRFSDRFTLPVSGRYQVLVSGTPTDTSNQGTFNFAMWRPRDQTNSLSLGSPVADAITTFGQRISYRLSFPQPALLLFDNLDPGPAVNLTLKGDLATPFESRDVRNIEATDDQIQRLPAGEYLATFFQAIDRTDPFRFRVLDATSARLIVPGAPVTVNFSETNSAEVVRFQAQAGDRFYLRMDGTSGFTRNAIGGRLFAASGERLWSSDSRFDVPTFTVPYTGTYYYALNGTDWQPNQQGVVRFTLLPVVPAPPEPLFETTLEAPDLLVSGLEATPASVTTGESVTASWTVRNEGGGAATNAFTDRVVIRNASGSVLANRTVTDSSTRLLPGATLRRSATLILPDGPRAAGTLEVEVTTDASNAVVERNTAGTGEANNLAATSIVGVLAPYPDLQVTGLRTLPATGWTPNGSVTVTWALTNSGTGRARAPWSDRVSIINRSTGQTVATGDVAPTGDLNSGATLVRSFNFTVPPAPGAFGRFAISVTTDADNLVFENSTLAAEDNNSSTVEVISGPDLAVADFRVPRSATPGVPFEVVTVITNRGSVALDGSWLNSFVVSRDAVPGGDTSLLFDGVTARLLPGEFLLRTNSLVLPVAGDSGALWLVVNLDAGNGIPEADRANNVGVSRESINVLRVLTLAAAASSVRENSATPLSITVTRNGPVDAALTVQLANDAPDELVIPAAVTIPVNQKSVSFDALPQPDDLLDGPQPVQLTASAAGYASSQTTVSVLDDTSARLSVALTSNRAVEGDSLQAVISRVPVQASPLAVQIQLSDASRVSAPRVATIPGGQSSVTVPVSIPQNLSLQAPLNVVLTGSAPEYQSGSGDFLLTDDDVPAITLTISPRTISEGAGPNATTVTLTRTPVTAAPVNVSLVAGLPDRITLPATVVIPANAASLSFPVGAVDNTTVDGPRSVSVGGWILESTGNTRVEELAPELLSITDDDGPTLSLQLAAAAVPEGQNPATTGRVSRNTATTSPLTVALVSSDSSEARVPAAVVIPAGTNQVSFPVETLDDRITDGNQTVGITASATGYAPSSASLVVTDFNLPDLVISRLTVPDTGIAGGVIPVSFRVENTGFAPITNGFLQSVSVGDSPVFGSGSLAAQLPWSAPVPPGGFLDQTANIRLPAGPGTYWIVVQADSARQVEELIEANNARISETPIRAGASYLATVSAQPKVALANTPVTLTGQATRAADGTPAANVSVDVHVEVKGVRRVLRVQTDAAGAFTSVFRPLPDEAGSYQVAASFPGLPMPATQDRFTLQGLRITPVNPVTIVERTSVSGTTPLLNLSDLPLSGLSANVLSNSPGYQVTAQLEAPRVEGDDELTLAFAVAASEAATSGGFAHIRVTSTEGASGDFFLPLVLERIVPRLVSDRDSLASTMTRGQQRVISFQVTNQGGTETGPLEVVSSTASWLSAATPTRLPPLAPGAELSVGLRLAPEVDLPLNVYSGEIVLRATNALLRVPFAFRAVSEARGALRVIAEDEYTYFAEGSPRPTNAVVEVTDALNGTIVANADAGPDGEVLFEDLREGDYVVRVTAEGHDAFRRTVRVSGTGTEPVPAATDAPIQRGTVLALAATTPAITPVTAFLPRQTVRYTFSVVPTTVEDRYTFRVESTFETQVPIPVITVDPPSVDLTLFSEDEFQINFTVSNQGLIAAQNVQFLLPSNSQYQMTPLISKIGRMAARSSLNIPVLVHRGPPASASSVHARSLRRAGMRADQSAAARLGVGGCTDLGRLIYSYPCGSADISGSAPVAIRISSACDFLAMAAAMGDAFASAFGFLPNLCCALDGSDGLSSYTPSSVIHTGPAVVSSPSDCSVGPGPAARAPAPSSPRKSLAQAPEDPGSEGAVCAKVRLRLDQRAVLTRDAFAARLELGNDTDSPLEDLEVALSIVGLDGQPANALFGIRAPELTGLGGVDGTGLLGARAEGDARWTLIPSLDAAPSAGIRKFLVGGTIVYRQDGVRVTVPLTPASIDVHPQPELVVRYFHERDVFSDDPFTRVLEPAVPYALAAQVLNVGFGPARALRIESGQPQIIENEKGLLIDFQAIGTRVENEDSSPSLTVNLGGIAPGTNKIARWLFTSTLQGSFTNFSATFRQEDAIAGVERLSLVRSVEIHELIRIVQAPGSMEDGRPDMLVNATGDNAVLPDILYASDGNTYPVTSVTNAIITGELAPTNLRLRLDVALPRGLAYLRVRHPGGTNYVLQQVLRPDGSDVGVGTNAWTTDRFIRGGALRPVRVNLLHLFDRDAPPFYTLVYAPAPAPIADVAAPVSRVAPLATASPLNFPVAWSGTDDASGIFSYNLHVSTDGGAFQLWLTNTPLTGAIFSGRSGRSYGFVASAIDRAGNIEAVRSLPDTSTRVEVVNQPPVISAPPPLTVRRGELMEGQFAATDPDPDQRVFFTLLPGAPRGLALDPETGTIRWQTGDGDVPGPYTVRVRASDNGLPSASSTATVSVTLIGINRAPVFEPLNNLLVTEGFRIDQPIRVIDPDVPRQNVRLTLVQAPATATLEPGGIFRWRTRPSDGPSTNRIVIRATDDGVPPATADLEFTVWVRDTAFDLLVGVGSTNLFVGDSASVPLSLNADPDVTRVSFRLPLAADRFSDLVLSSLTEEVLSATVADVADDHALVQLQLRPGSSLTATRRIANLGFTAMAPGFPGIVVVTPDAISGTRSDGSSVPRSGAQEGTIVLVGADPILRMNSGPRLVLFGLPGKAYRVETAPTLFDPWTELTTVTLTSETAAVDVADTILTTYLRVVELP